MRLLRLLRLPPAPYIHTRSAHAPDSGRISPPDHGGRRPAGPRSDGLDVAASAPRAPLWSEGIRDHDRAWHLAASSYPSRPHRRSQPAAACRFGTIRLHQLTTHGSDGDAATIWSLSFWLFPAILWAVLRLLGDPQVRRAVAVAGTCGCRRVGLGSQNGGEIL
jgi:hypothetical protein